MYSKDEITKLKQEFWTVFGQYMALQLSSEGFKINWVNYKTGIKHLHFKMDADSKHASIGIEINHSNTSIQELIFEQFKQFKTLLHNQLAEEWIWEMHAKDSFGKTVSKISTKIDKVNIFRKEDWPEIISFLKPRLIALDEFWNDARHSFSSFT
ncbi:MAG: DUF4268 domain-containing protein [Bacteroidota bacterium]